MDAIGSLLSNYENIDSRQGFRIGIIELNGTNNKVFDKFKINKVIAKCVGKIKAVTFNFENYERFRKLKSVSFYYPN